MSITPETIKPPVFAKLSPRPSDLPPDWQEVPGGWAPPGTITLPIPDAPPTIEGVHWRDVPRRRADGSYECSIFGGPTGDPALDTLRAHLRNVIPSPKPPGIRERLAANAGKSAIVTGSALPFISMEKVKEKAVEWEWWPYIPRGKVTMVVGDAGDGKSFASLDLAARKSRGGEMPFGGKVEAGTVLLLSREDGLEDTLKPRLRQQGADMSRVHALPLDAPFKLEPKYVTQLEEAIEKHEADWVIIDPIADVLGAGMNMNAINETYEKMKPLASLALRQNVVILVVAHAKKGQTERALHKVMGSVGFGAAVRSALLAQVPKDASDPAERLLTHVKNNLGSLGPSLRYRIESGADVRGMGFFAWLGQSKVRGDDLMGDDETRHRRSAVEKAKVFLREMLKDGPQPTATVYEEAAKAKISARSLERARADMGVDPYRDKGVWWMKLGGLE